MVYEIVKAAGKISKKTIIGTFKHSLKFIEKETPLQKIIKKL